MSHAAKRANRSWLTKGFMSGMRTTMRDTYSLVSNYYHGCEYLVIIEAIPLKPPFMSITYICVNPNGQSSMCDVYRPFTCQ